MPSARLRLITLLAMVNPSARNTKMPTAAEFSTVFPCTIAPRMRCGADLMVWITEMPPAKGVVCRVVLFCVSVRL